MLGPTERNFLKNMEEIVEAALPDEKLGQYYTRDSAEDFLLKTRSYYRKESAAVTHKLGAKSPTQ